MPCLPIGSTPLDPSCVNQTLALDCGSGDLSISNGNTVNLGCAVSLLETVTAITSFTLTGNILQIVYSNETGVPQYKNVDLTPIAGGNGNIGVISSNSILLHNANNTLSATLLIDPASTLPISSSPNGVLFNCCPETSITPNITNTIQLLASGTNGYTLTANVKHQDSQSIAFSESSNGLMASLKYSTDANNVAQAGTDGALYIQGASAQLASLPNNGFVSTGGSGTLLVGSDSKLYRIPDPIAQTPITVVDTNSVNLIVSGPNNHTIQADVNINNTNSVTLSETGAGIQADLKIDTVTPGNVSISESVNGVAAHINEASILSIQTAVATVQNPVTKIYGNLNNGAGGYAVAYLSQYGMKFPAFTTTQRLAIPVGDLYDTLFVFDSTIRAFMWYDAVNTAWVQIT